jgi:hypothetical protein
MENIFIYYLHHGDNQPFYIGKTKSLKTRLSSHKRKFGKNIQICELTIVKQNEWKFWETYYINLYKEKGYNLKNNNTGGGGCNKQSEYSKQLIRKKLTGRYYPKEWSIKQSMSTKGKSKNHPLDRGENISKAKKGIPNPKLKEARTGKPHPKKGWKIKQFDLYSNHIKDWESAKIAGETLNISPALIRDAALGKQKTAGKYKWNYDK